MSRHFDGGPIWIDPRVYQQYRIGEWRRFGTGDFWETTTTDNTNPVPPRVIPTPAAPVDEERIREIVREEIADLPIPFDVPDAPPEDGDV